MSGPFKYYLFILKRECIALEVLLWFMGFLFTQSYIFLKFLPECLETIDVKGGW
jgi:hypothetical protein